MLEPNPIIPGRAPGSDLAAIADEDGSFAYDGRGDDMIEVGGLWVSPLIEKPPDGTPPRAGDGPGRVPVEGLPQIKAFAIPKGGATDELRARCKETVPRYQYPQMVELVDDFPCTATGKIQRFEWRDASEKTEPY